jgi:transposase
MSERQYQGKQLTHEVLEHYRFRAIELHKAGEKVKDIARFFGVHPNSVSRWFVTYRQKGEKALRSKKATGRPPKLTLEEFNEILSDLKRPATDFGFETPLWTCKRVRHIIHQRTEKRLDASNVWRWLGKLGLSNKKPERRAIEQNPREARRWLKREWPKILAHTRRWQAVLYFEDEAGISLTPVLGKTWCPKGKTAIVRVTGRRGGLCVSSAITPRGRLVFRIEKGRVNAATFLGFLTQIRQHHPRRKVIVVTDRARPHIAGKVKKYAVQHGKSFALYYLPPYSPELNPAEHVWGYLKGRKMKAHTVKTHEELKSKTLALMRSIQMRPPLVRSFFHEIGYLT